MTRYLWRFLGLLWLAAGLPFAFSGQGPEGVRPLHQVPRHQIQSLVPAGVLLLLEPPAIEAFLAALDERPPDWDALFGQGGVGHDERLFALNRNRDRTREGRAALGQPVAFLWTGELSAYDPRHAGFRVAIGPEVIPTQWGLIRFKPAELPGALVAVPSPATRESLRNRVGRGERVEVLVLFTGRLVPEESIIYAFAHEEPGRGMVMPVVRAERIDYVLAD